MHHRHNCLIWIAVVAALLCPACGGGGTSSPGTHGTAAPAPTAAFSWLPAPPTATQSVQFTDASTGSPTSWLWSFGDGGTSSTQSPSHTYSAAGTFTVSLTAGHAAGSTTATRSVVVAPADPTTPSSLNIVLGRPTDNSMVASVGAGSDTEVYLEYGTAPGTYTNQTLVHTVSASSPIVIGFSGLKADTPYFYRARYRARTETNYRADTEYAFHTKRLSGSPFTFVVQADPHLNSNSSTAVYSRTLLNELTDRPDFMVDLGETSMVDTCAIDGTTLCAPPAPATAATVGARTAMMRSYFDLVCHSMPLFMVLGNHDGEAGWQSGSTGANLDAWSLTARKALYVNPEPDGFYSGNTEPSPGLGLRQNYYAFEWGDALIVVLDPYTYTSPKPGQDPWGWTLGATQYQWFAKTLAASRARFTFVFSHHLVPRFPITTTYSERGIAPRCVAQRSNSPRYSRVSRLAIRAPRSGLLLP